MDCVNLYKEFNFTLDDCKKIVEKKLQIYDEYNICYEFILFEEMLGYFGEHGLIKIRIGDGRASQKLVFFAKFYPRPYLQGDEELVNGAFRKEIFIYNIIETMQKQGVSFIDTIVPKCYLAEQKVLVLEDLGRKGFKTPPRYQYLDYNHLVTVIKTLAKLHTSSLIFEEKNGRIGDQFAEYSETFYSEKPDHKGRLSFLAGVKAIKSSIDLFHFPGVLTKEEFKIKAEKVCHKLFELIQPSKRYRNVICHGDMWSSNLMIKYEDSTPVDCALVDFQMARYAPPAHDLMALIYLTTTRDFRRQNFENLCNIYYDELSNNVAAYNYDLNTLLPKDEFEESCEEQKVFSSIQSATYCQIQQVKNDYIDELIKDSTLWDFTLYEDRSTMVRENCERDEAYRWKIEDTLNNLKEICEIVYT